MLDWVAIPLRIIVIITIEQKLRRNLKDFNRIAWELRSFKILPLVTSYYAFPNSFILVTVVVGAGVNL